GAESQVPAVWHGSRAIQSGGLAPTQAPAWQASLCVHALPSVQVVPLGLFGLEQTPVVVSQVPAEWHWSRAVQTTGLAPTQAPAWQAAVGVDALRSGQGGPLVCVGEERSAGAGLDGAA